MEIYFALNLTFFCGNLYIYIYLAFYMEQLKNFTDILIVLSYRDAIYLTKITLVKYSLKRKVLKNNNTIMYLNLAESWALFSIVSWALYWNLYAVKSNHEWLQEIFPVYLCYKMLSIVCNILLFPLKKYQNFIASVVCLKKKLLHLYNVMYSWKCSTILAPYNSLNFVSILVHLALINYLESHNSIFSVYLFQ